jgi:hypothetical protein
MKKSRKPMPAPQRPTWRAPDHRFLFRRRAFLPAHRQFNVSVDAHVDCHRAVFDGERLVDLAEIVGKTVSGRLWLTAVWKSATFVMKAASKEHIPRGGRSLNPSRLCPLP